MIIRPAILAETVLKAVLTNGLALCLVSPNESKTAAGCAWLAVPGWFDAWFGALSRTCKE